MSRVRNRRLSLGFCYTPSAVATGREEGNKVLSSQDNAAGDLKCLGDNCKSRSRNNMEGEDQDASGSKSTNTNTSTSTTSMFRCSCNAGTIDEEFSTLREATSGALRQSWVDADKLRRDASTKKAKIDNMQKAVDNLEKEQADITSRMQKTEKKIERKKVPRKRLSLVEAWKTLKGLKHRSSPSCRDGLATLSLTSRTSHSQFSLNSSVTSRSDSHSSLNRSYFVNTSLPENNSVTSLGAASVSTSNTTNVEWPEIFLAKDDEGDASSGPSFICANENKTEEKQSQSEVKISELKMKIRQREETIACLESTIYQNTEIMQDLQSQMISWQAYTA